MGDPTRRFILGTGGGVGQSAGLLEPWWRRMDRWWPDLVGLGWFWLPGVQQLQQQGVRHGGGMGLLLGCGDGLIAAVGCSSAAACRDLRRGGRHSAQ
jgi:hypothetical protein